MTAVRIPNSSDFQANRGAQLTVRPAAKDFFIKNAYSLNGKFYDITYSTTPAETQKLQSLNPAALVQQLQEQMRGCLNASHTLASPDKIRFSLQNDRVYAHTQAKATDISSYRDSATDKTIQVMARSLCRERGLLQSSNRQAPNPQPPAAPAAVREVPATRVTLFTEGMKNWLLESEGVMLFAGFATGPFCILAGFVELVVNLIAAIFSDSQNTSEYLKGALEGLEHFGLGIYATLVSCFCGWIGLLGLLAQTITNLTG